MKKTLKSTDQKIHKDDLFHGEIYRTTSEDEWAQYIEPKDENGFIKAPFCGIRVIVPAEQDLLFRSFVKYDPNAGTELALFYWLEQKKTICLLVSKKQCYFAIKHIPWEARETSKLGQEIFLA